VTITNGVLSTITDPDGFSVQFGYDADRKMTSRRTRRGFTTTYEYAKSHRLTKVTIPVGRVAGDNTVAVTNFRSWDEVGLAFGAGTQSASDTSFAYTLIQGPRAAIADDASFWVDRWGAPTKIVNATGATTRLVRSSPVVPALVTKVISPDNRVDSMLYNDRGNLVELLTITSGVTGSTPLPAGTAKTRWTYNWPGTPDSPDSIIDPENAVTRYAYDSVGITSQITAPNGHVTQYVSWPSGTAKGQVRLVKELSVPAWNPSLRVEQTVDTSRTGFAFNALGNVVGDTSATGRVRRYPRDAKQRVADLFDEAGHRTEFKYDSLNRLVKTLQHVEQAGNTGFPADPGFTAPLVSSTTYNIDVVDFVVDPRTVVRRFTYDFANRQITEKDENQNIETRWYNAAGQIDSVLTRTGRMLRHFYDAAGRVRRTDWPAVLDAFGQPVAGADSIIYAYDALGRMTQASTSWPGPASITRTYYGTGDLRTDVENASTPNILVSQAYNYDRAGRRISHRIGTPGIAAEKDSVAYSYDVTGLRKMKVWWRTSGTAITDSVRFVWDALGRRDTLAYSSGAKFAYAYDQDGMQRLFCSTSASATPSTTTPDMFSSRVVKDVVDQDGMIREVNQIGAAVPGGGCLTTNRLSSLRQLNTYDNRHQLKSQVQGALTQSYTYDGSGNIVQTIKSSGTTSTHNDSVPAFTNQLARRYTSGSSLFWQYRYNDDGSRFDENPCTTACSGPNIGYRQYLYDGRNRMVGANEKQCSGTCQAVLVANCYYDPLGRFLHPCENGSPNLGYDGDNVVRTGSDASNIAWTFIHGPNTDEPLLGRYASVNLTAFFVTDGNGRQYFVADRTGFDISSRQEYSQQGGKYAGGTANASSFGADRHSSSSIPGVSFFRNRAYDQATGRWTQEDPIGLAGGMNLYQFNGNNPVMYSDPFGLCGPLMPVCIAALAVGSRVLASPAGQRLMDRGHAVGARVVGQLGTMQARLGNIMQELSTHDHLQAARLERTGRLVTGGDHAAELQGFANSLRTMTVTLKNAMSDQRLSDEVRQQATDMLKRVSPMLDQIKEALR
jgi:RHS repeat-associated protein